MNINDYKELMDSLEVKNFSVEELMVAMLHKKRKRKKSIMLVTIITIMLFAIISPRIFLNNDNLSIIVYAADGKPKILTEDASEISLNLSTTYIDGDETNIGTANMVLFFKVEGIGIDIIEVSCSDNEISRNQLDKVNAYFVKYTDMSYQDYQKNAWEINNSDDFLRLEFGEEFMTVTSLIGNLFTTKYEEQESVKNGLRMKVVTNDNFCSNFSTEETELEFNIHYINGKVVEKKIRIMASNNIFSGVDVVMEKK